ncbi:MAG: hypothetical protein GC149_18040 [Gammaproteobacteria bacterium]|nr:hypothetical protein [Gammaproteobacteria bacterium]
MGYIRNLALFTIISILTIGCGGGNSALSDSSQTAGGSGGSSTPAPAPGGTTATVTLKWTAPSTRSDNTAVSLSEISGYRLYYGNSATNTPYYVNISGGASTQYTLTLPSGSYYFRISAIDTQGYEGLRSAAAQKSI